VSSVQQAAEITDVQENLEAHRQPRYSNSRSAQHTTNTEYTEHKQLTASASPTTTTPTTLSRRYLEMQGPHE
jgi:hypothetical protein